MAGRGALVSEFASYSDESLADLTSPGLVRRAARDAEQSPPERLGPGRYRIEQNQVELRLPLTESRCDCPSNGLCRHILAAVRSERDRGDVAPPDAGAELLALDAATVRKFAGRLWSRALTVPAPTAEALGPREILFRGQGWECRWLAGLGPEGMTCSCSRRPPCVHRVSALLSQLPERPEAPEPAAPDAPDLKPALQELLRPGLDRLNPASLRQLNALATRAAAAQQGRAARLLGAAAGQAERLLARSGQADSARLLHLLARAAVAREPAARAERKTLESLELVALGARSFSTPSGWKGLTVYLLGAQWAIWSELRPPGQPFDAARSFERSIPFPGAGPPRRWMGQRLLLRQARLSAAGRLAGAAEGELLGPAPLASLPAERDWRSLPGRARPLFQGQSEVLTWLAPGQVSGASFDRVRQESVRLAADDQGRRLELRLPFLREEVSRRFETARLERVLARLTLRGPELCAEPLSWSEPGGKLVHPELGSGPLSAAEEEELPEPLLVAPGRCARLLLEAEEALVGWAEAGGSAPASLAALAGRARELGLERAERELTQPDLLRSALVVRCYLDELALLEAFGLGPTT